MFPRTKLIVLFVSALFVAYGLVGGIMDKVSAGDDIYRDLSIFADVLNRVKEDYVEQPDLKRGMLGALHGMMEALDPYSSYVDRETYQELGSLEQEEASPGIVLSKRYGYGYVVSVIAGSSAEREGLRTGDLLESIGGKVTTAMSLWEARRSLEGMQGSSVDIRVIRSRRSEPSSITLVRQEQVLPDATARLLEEGVGYLQIPHFEEGTSGVVSAKLKTLKSLGAAGLLVDVRGTALGDVREAVEVSELFLAPGRQVVTVRDRRGRETVHRSGEESIITGVPVVLLIDGGTSGAAEVFAAALVDNQVAQTVGEKTNGYGSRQEYFELEDGSVLQISTELFYRAAGEPIQARNLRESGVSPDVRSPSYDFVTNFYYDRTPDDPEANLGEDFYRDLSQAVRGEQFSQGLEQVLKQLEKAA